MKNMKKWMVIPAVAGVLAIGGVALAEDSIPGVAKQTDKMISLQDAKKVATDKVKGANVTEVELDEDDGRYHYDIDLKDGKYEYDLEVDAVTGKIIKFEKEVENDSKAQTEKVADQKQAMKDKKDMLSEEQALKIAKQHASGVVTEVELDDNVYEIEMEDGKIEYEVDIDAYTGAILSFEQEDNGVTE
ncbi:PepSY domain-containing protein [Sporosarcina luteola]|uniref:PepSY domain-containing protein n=1 Tax=Sporosarcina luteola TaxID=582850 RepID=UPI00203D98F2|nr:PepSY domain-containing protein [Sporosarcina luteola]MCM3744386.1 PepSY domain-containing protein [Sporosarcina luteola]